MVYFLIFFGYRVNQVSLICFVSRWGWIQNPNPKSPLCGEIPPNYAHSSRWV